MVEELVNGLLEERAALQYERFELEYVSAPIARDRLLMLVGQLSTNQLVGAAAEAAQRNAAQQGISPSMSNLIDRLTVDRQGNALIFLGRPAEQRSIEIGGAARE